mmetsp:Transcript_329/g.1334  ORF Transcript_329/g.1334 Transcript_329/m.1334 type:complete len:217 (-) Transcript_329:193-843(-)
MPSQPSPPRQTARSLSRRRGKGLLRRAFPPNPRRSRHFHGARATRRAPWRAEQRGRRPCWRPRRPPRTQRPPPGQRGRPPSCWGGDWWSRRREHKRRGDAAGDRRPRSAVGTPPRPARGRRAATRHRRRPHRGGRRRRRSPRRRGGGRPRPLPGVRGALVRPFSSSCSPVRPSSPCDCPTSKTGTGCRASPCAAYLMDLFCGHRATIRTTCYESTA